MVGFIFLLFILVIGLNLNKKAKKAAKLKSNKARRGVPAASAKFNAARRATQSGKTTVSKYETMRRKRRKAQMKANTGLWISKHRVDKNRSRRSDWGVRGNRSLLLPQTLALIVGGFLTIYWVLTALYS